MGDMATRCGRVTGRPGLSVVIPAFDEADGIELTLEAVRALAERLACRVSRVELLVVDDGSTDGTGEVVEAWPPGSVSVRLLRHPRRRGLGAALRTGFGAAAGDIVLYTDADLPFDLAEVPGALDLLDQPDIDVVALYRNGRTGEGPRRWLYSHLYNGLTRVVLGLHVRDVNFAGKMLPRAVLEGLDLRSEGSFIDAELLARVQGRGLRIAQAGVEYLPRSRGVSTLSSWPVIAGMLREMRTLAPEIRAGGRS